MNIPTLSRQWISKCKQQGQPTESSPNRQNAPVIARYPSLRLACLLVARFGSYFDLLPCYWLLPEIPTPNTRDAVDLDRARWYGRVRCDDQNGTQDRYPWNECTSLDLCHCMYAHSRYSKDLQPANEVPRIQLSMPYKQTVEIAWENANRRIYTYM